MTAVAAGFAIRGLPARSVAAGDTLDLGDIVLERGRSIHAHVVDPAGKPVLGARVVMSANGSTSLDTPGVTSLARGVYVAITNPTGQAVVSGLPSHPLHVIATGASGTSSDRVLGPNDSSIELVISPQPQ